MKIAIAGSRGIDLGYMPHLEEAIRLSGFDITEVWHGANYQSADALADRWARSNGIYVREFPMESRRTLEELGIPPKAAGPRRNKRMVDAGPDGLIALWDGATPGTKDIRDRMKKSFPSFVYRLDGAPHERYPKQLPLFRCL